MNAAPLVAVVLLAGCLEPTLAPLRASPPFAVQSGQAILFRAVVAPGEVYGLDVEGWFEYRGVGVRHEDSAQCSAVAAGTGWLMQSPGISRTPFNAYVGRQQDGASTWLVAADAHIGSSDGLGVLGSGMDPTRDLILVGHEQVGPDVESSLTVKPDQVPIEQVLVSRFWCLDGLSRFTGDYLVSTYHVQTEAVQWSEDFKHGILLRAQAFVNATGLHVTGPAGRLDVPPDLWEGHRLDATFCSTEPGAWSLGANQMQLVGTWRFRVFAFDTVLPSLPCTGWIKSPVPSLGGNGTA